MCLLDIFELKRIPMLQSLYEKVFRVCRRHVLWVFSYFSTSVSGTASAFVPLPLSVPLVALASLILCECHLETFHNHMHQHQVRAPVKDFRIVYTHRQKVPASELVPVNPSLVDGPPIQPSTPFSDLDVLIVLWKGKRSCTDHLISNFVLYDHLNPQFRQFALSLSSVSIPNFCEEALLVSAWKRAMNEEMGALVSLGTWELASTPPDAVVVGCRWVYTLKYHPDGLVDRYKARLGPKVILRCMT